MKPIPIYLHVQTIAISFIYPTDADKNCASGNVLWVENKKFILKVSKHIYNQ